MKDCDGLIGKKHGSLRDAEDEAKSEKTHPISKRKESEDVVGQIDGHAMDNNVKPETDVIKSRERITFFSETTWKIENGTNIYNMNFEPSLDVEQICEKLLKN